jgi:hypothetical protein
MPENANKPGFLEAVEKMGKDSKFRESVIANIDEALKEYQLEPKQKTALTEMAKGVAADAKESAAAAAKAATKWYQPSSFKGAVAAGLSLVLMLLLLYAVVRTYGLISTPPTAVEIGETTVQWSSYDRATAFFNVLLPLFTAVVTFYLGASVEGKRGDKAEERADKAEEKASDAKDEAKEANAKKEGLAKGVRSVVKEARTKGTKRSEARDLESSITERQTGPTRSTVDRLEELLEEYS